MIQKKRDKLNDKSFIQKNSYNSKFSFDKNKSINKNIIQKNPSKENIDLNKRDFIKKSVLGLAGLGGVALFSKFAKAGIFFRDGTTQSTAAGGTWTIIGTVAASNSASLDVTGLDSTYDTYCIAMSDLEFANDNVDLWIRLGDSGGFDSGASDYAWLAFGDVIAGTTFAIDGEEDNLDAQINWGMLTSTEGIGTTGAGEGYGGIAFLHSPGDGTSESHLSGHSTYTDVNGWMVQAHNGGGRNAVITVDRVQVLADSGNITSGRVTVWGLKHA